MATRIVPFYTVATDYTQAEEDTLAGLLSGQSMGSAVIFNTETGRTRIWNGSAFENVPLLNPDGSNWVATTVTGVVIGDGSSVLAAIVGAAGQFLRRNAGNTAYEFATLAGGGDMLKSENLSGLADYPTARTNLGLVIGTNVQAFAAALTTYAGIAPSANVQTLLSAADYAAFKTSLSLNNVTNESKATMFTNSVFTGTFGVAAGAIANAALANGAVANLSGTNSGDNATNSQYSGLVTNANHSGDATGSTALTLATVATAGTTGSADLIPVVTINVKGLTTGITTAANTGGWTVHKVSGSNATTTGQALVDITGLVTGTLANSTKYEIEVILHVSTSAVTTGCRYAVFGGGSGGAATINAMVNGTTTAAAAGVETINTIATQTATAYLTTSGSSGTIIIRGFVTTRGSGTADIRIQFLKVTSGTATAFIGSVFRYRLA